MSPINSYLNCIQAVDRVVVVHADDIGMCHATLLCYRRTDGVQPGDFCNGHGAGSLVS